MRVIVAVTSHIPGVGHCGGWEGVVEALEWWSWSRHVSGEVPQGMGQAGTCTCDGAPSTWGRQGHLKQGGEGAEGAQSTSCEGGNGYSVGKDHTGRSWGKYPERRVEVKQDPKLSGRRREAAWQRCKGDSWRTARASKGPCRVEGTAPARVTLGSEVRCCCDWYPLLLLYHVNHLKHFLEIFLVLCQHCKSLPPGKGNALASQRSISKRPCVSMWLGFSSSLEFYCWRHRCLPSLHLSKLWSGP